jgi:hypothetical protein
VNVSARSFHCSAQRFQQYIVSIRNDSSLWRRAQKIPRFFFLLSFSLEFIVMSPSTSREWDSSESWMWSSFFALPKNRVVMSSGDDVVKFYLRTRQRRESIEKCVWTYLRLFPRLRVSSGFDYRKASEILIQFPPEKLLIRSDRKKGKTPENSIKQL